ncbi:MAG: iron-sulfur cluster assembly scaffold protein [Thermodesulfobacteriota bacterium]|nr:iron-sulfur cluster assembly scaffold protein [Thermodesulfobacteriota bacterium]
MNDKLDTFLDNLQEEIFDEARGVLGEAGFERWQDPKYMGRMEKYDVHASVTGSCGDTIEMFLKFDNNCVTDASYITDGCGTSSVCGSFAAEFAIGRKSEELADITGDTILAKLGTVPEDEQHCTTLAAGAVQEALRLYMTDNQCKMVKLE